MEPLPIPAIGRPAGLRPIRTELDNGVVILAKRTRKTPAVTLNLTLRAGAASDPPEATGAVHLLARVIDRGTERRSAHDIATELDNRGISLTVTAGRHIFTLSCTCLADDFETVLSLLGEIIRWPSLPPLELTTRKAEVVTLIKQDDDNPAVRAVEELMALLYGDGHPYGRKMKGSVESVTEITRDQLAGLHATLFGPASLMAVVVGDVDMAHASAAVAGVFGDWKRQAPAAVVLPHATPAADRRRVVIPMMNKAQADLAYGFTGVARADPSYYALWLMNNALGQYAMGGRLGDSIRERQGMAYYVSSALEAGLVEGPLLIRAGVSAANVDRAIDSIDEELRLVRRDGLSAREVAESRQYLIGSMPRALETNAGIANFLQTSEAFQLGLDFDERLPGILEAITLDQVNDGAARLLDPDRATIVIAGPYPPA
jgi:zinc protease